jgi:NADPH-dependent 2,4-dienoyl-CoA reductase/sulfur reductase-like enzyme
MLNRGAVVTTISSHRGTQAASARGSALDRVVIVGQTPLGFAYAKFLKLWGAGGIDVTLIRAGSSDDPISAATLDREQLSRFCRQHGVDVIDAQVASVDADIRIVTLSNGSNLPFDRLIVAPDTLPKLASRVSPAL